MRILFFLVFSLSFIRLPAQQIADTSYNAQIKIPEYALGQGPSVLIDAGHYNFHTKNGGYQAFARLLERDGYRVGEYSGLFSRQRLSGTRILVISNALNALNVDKWYLPVLSAFTPGEIQAIKRWVREGGRLLLIADHMPMSGAALELAAAFGFTFTNGFALDPTGNGVALFTFTEGTLINNRITEGRNQNERVDTVASFTGQAFKIPEAASPILQLNQNFINLLPDTAWVFNENTRKMSAEGWYQGACMDFGKGKIVVFGEAAMFTAQLAGPQRQKMGMNHPLASKNYQLLLNSIHWLDE